MIFTGYHPRNYQPNAEPTQLATPRQIEAAIEAHAEFIHKSGDQAYRWRYNDFWYANWDGLRYGSWLLWREDPLPAGELVEL
jgi:hypothetical protein